ncbi:MAG: hypothetical protein CME06_16780 [Gemmatimonadetes bacterium]|nr:hypothetical protein [Gemmatimonadota bacterium]
MKLGSTPAFAALIAAMNLVSPPAWAGDLDPDLEMRLRAASPNTEFRVIATLDDRPDAPALARRLYVEGWSPAERHEKVVCELQIAAARSQGPLFRELRRAALEGLVGEITPLWIVNAIAFEATAEAIRGAAGALGVSEIVEDSRVALEEPVEMHFDAPSIQAREWGIDMIRAPEVWAMGYFGAGRVVCNLDTGVEGTHPALQDKWRGAEGGDWQHHWFDPSTGSSFPIDDSYHGTHTMGTMVASEVGDTVGVAPGAQWIAALTIGGSGDFISKTLQAFEWAADPDGDPGTPDHPDVISNSWTDLQPRCQNTLLEAIDNAEAAGAAVVFSAGNSGPSPESITSPKNRATTPVNIFATGALQSNESIASFSSRGPSYCDHVTIKPEATAPGDDVRSTMPSGYGLLSGTSMAAPHVAGAVALLKEVNPSLDPETVKTILIETARDAGSPGEDNTYGNGIIDLYAAFIAATNGFGTLSGLVQDSETADPLPAGIQVLGTPRQTRADEDGLFVLPLPADSTFDIETTYFGYAPAAFQVNIAPSDTLQMLVDLDPVPTGSIAGVVRDIGGVPLVGADVAVLNTPIEATTTDGLGAYRIDDVPADSTYQLGASSCGLLPGGRQITVVANQVASGDITLLDLEVDDMESGENGWTHAAVTPSYLDEWHLSQERNHTPGGDTSWKCGADGPGDYSDLVDAGLVTHCLDLRPGSILSFWHWMDAEIETATTAWDGGIVEISTNGVDFAQITPDGGYPYTIVDNPASPFDPGTPCFSGTHDWREESFDLSAFAGEAYLRFRFGTDGYVTEEGWHIDDMVVDSTLPDVSIAALGAPATVTAGEFVEWELNVSNNTAQPQTVDVWLRISGPVGEGLLVLANDIDIPAGQSGTRGVGLTVPLAAPEGAYTVENTVGVHPSTPYDFDAVDVEVVSRD